MTTQEQETPPDVLALVYEASSLRLELALDRSVLETPPALQRKRCDAMSGNVRGEKDPATGEKIALSRVWAVFEPDERGLLEVLITTSAQEAVTVFVRGREVAYVAEGW